MEAIPAIAVRLPHARVALLAIGEHGVHVGLRPLLGPARHALERAPEGAQLVVPRWRRRAWPCEMDVETRRPAPLTG